MKIRRIQCVCVCVYSVFMIAKISSFRVRECVFGLDVCVYVCVWVRAIFAIFMTFNFGSKT